jgi:hypothetical protein
LLETLLKKANEYENACLNATDKMRGHEDIDERKFISDCKIVLEQTQALRQASANPQLLRPEDYVRIESFLLNYVMNRCTSSSHSCNSSMVETKCKCFNQNIPPSDRLLFISKTCTGVSLKQSVESRAESKGFFSYVTFVASYVIFLFIVTYLLSRIGKI